MNIGDIQVDFPLDAHFKLDGGAMFGVVPKPLWSQETDVDDRNRIPLVARPMLLRTGDRTILVDTGIGTKWSAKEQDIYDIDYASGDIVESLSNLDVSPTDVTDVIFTHLHFDHAGATTRASGDRFELTFPDATHHVQRTNWEWANNPTERDAASYRKEDFLLLEKTEQLNLLDGNSELFPGVKLQRIDGHTKGLQMVRVEDDKQELMYVTDLIPTSAHLPLPYIMGYDLWPMETLDEKKTLFHEPSDKKRMLAFEHDPNITVCTLQMDTSPPEVDQVIV